MPPGGRYDSLGSIVDGYFLPVLVHGTAEFAAIRGFTRFGH